MKIKELPVQERPRERLELQGEAALSNAELLAITIGSGMQGKSALALAHELLAHFGSLKALAHASVADLTHIKGLGKAKAVKLKAVLALGLRLAHEQSPQKTPLRTSAQAYLWVKDLIAHREKEVFGLILQDVRCHPIKWEEVSVGTLTQALVHPREVFYPAIAHRAASFILAHNHPSGDPTPSKEDLEITRNLFNLSRMMGIPINDHIIVCNTSFTSLKEKLYN